MSEWGNRGDNPDDKPKFPWIKKGNQDMFTGSNNVANTVATVKGWEFNWPWGREVLVTIGQLVNPVSSSTSPSSSGSPSASGSPSVSPSSSKSPSASESPSASPSASKSPSASASPSV